MNRNDTSGGKYRARSLSVDWEKLFGTTAVELTDSTHHGFNVVEKDSFIFITKSKYTGGWNSIGLADFGTYTYPQKVEYEGNHENSMFHNEGCLKYPMGHKCEGIWEKDRLVSHNLFFPDGLMYEDPWEYCQLSDRRFWTSIEEGLNSVCEEHVTNEFPSREIPPGCYDTGDGFYNPKTKCVISSIDPQKILRIPSLAEEKWIIDNCRKAWDEPIGYRSDLYERWCTGRHSEKYEDKVLFDSKLEHNKDRFVSDEINIIEYNDENFESIQEAFVAEENN